MIKCNGCKVITLLVGVGALNWGLVALFNLNLVNSLLGEATLASKIVYILIGISGLIAILSLVKSCPACKK